MTKTNDHNLTSVADLKRALTMGARVECLAHFRDDLVGTVRPVCRVQGNGVYLRGATDRLGAFDAAGESWMAFPKRADVVLDGDTFTLTDHVPALSYRVLPAVTDDDGDAGESGPIPPNVGTQRVLRAIGGAGRRLYVGSVDGVAWMSTEYAGTPAPAALLTYLEAATDWEPGDPNETASRRFEVEGERKGVAFATGAAPDLGRVFGEVLAAPRVSASTVGAGTRGLPDAPNVHSVWVLGSDGRAVAVDLRNVRWALDAGESLALATVGLRVFVLSLDGDGCVVGVSMPLGGIETVDADDVSDVDAATYLDELAATCDDHDTALDAGALVVTTRPLPVEVTTWLDRLVHPPKRAWAEAVARHLLHGDAAPEATGAVWERKATAKVTRKLAGLGVAMAA